MKIPPFLWIATSVLCFVVPFSSLASELEQTPERPSVFRPPNPLLTQEEPEDNEAGAGAGAGAAAAAAAAGPKSSPPLSEAEFLKALKRWPSLNKWVQECKGKVYLECQHFSDYLRTHFNPDMLGRMNALLNNKFSEELLVNYAWLFSKLSPDQRGTLKSVSRKTLPKICQSRKLLETLLSLPPDHIKLGLTYADVLFPDTPSFRLDEAEECFSLFAKLPEEKIKSWAIDSRACTKHLGFEVQISKIRSHCQK